MDAIVLFREFPDDLFRIILGRFNDSKAFPVLKRLVQDRLKTITDIWPNIATRDNNGKERIHYCILIVEKCFHEGLFCDLWIEGN